MPPNPSSGSLYPRRSADLQAPGHRLTEASTGASRLGLSDRRRRGASVRLGDLLFSSVAVNPVATGPRREEMRLNTLRASRSEGVEAADIPTGLGGQTPTA
jgi:hypothetical protein